MEKNKKYKMMSGLLAMTMASSAFTNVMASDLTESEPEDVSNAEVNEKAEAINADGDTVPESVTGEPEEDSAIIPEETAESPEGDSAVVPENVAAESENDSTIIDAINNFVFSVMSEDELSDREAAEAVKASIEELKAVTADMSEENYTSYFMQIKEVREAYDALSYYGKTIVGNTDLQVLTSTESKYNTLKNKDIDAVNAVIEALAELDADNYLGMSSDFVAARELCETFNERQAALQGTEQGDAEYIEIMAAVQEAEEKLADISAAVEAYMEVTMDVFRTAVDTTLDFGITELSQGEALDDAYATDEHEYITRFVSDADYNKFLEIEDYINTVIDQYKTISTSPLYKDFLMDDAFRAAVVTYLENYYMYKADQLKVIYGAPDGLQENITNTDLWDEDTQEILCKYLETQRGNADNALDAAKLIVGDEIEDLSEYQQYCSDLFEAMNMSIATEIDKFVMTVLPLTGAEVVEREPGERPDSLYNENDLSGKECKELQFTSEDIAMAAAAKQANENFNISIQAYLYEYDYSRYNKLFDSSNDTLANSIIQSSLDQLEALAAEELGKYHELTEKIAEYNLNYTSGYESLFEEGAEDTDPDAFIAQIEEELNEIKREELIQYYATVTGNGTDEAVAAATLKVDGESDYVTDAIESYKTKLAAIKDLRNVSNTATEAYDAFEIYFGYAYMMDQASSYNDFAKHEDVVSFVDDFITAYNTINETEISLDDLMSAFDTAVAAKSAYVMMAAEYATTYTEDNFEYPEEMNREQPYMSVQEIDEIDDLAGIIYKHIDMTDFMDRVDACNTLVFDLAAEKEELYLAKNNFESVEAAKAAYAELEAEYNLFSDEQKYCIKRATEEQLSGMRTELAAWDSAINVMNMIDAIDETDDWNEFIELTNAAKEAYTAITGTRAQELVADAALAKLNFDISFAALFEDIIAIPVIVSQHQIDGRYGNPNYEPVVAELRIRYDELVTGDYESVNSFVEMAKQLLEAREYEVACAVAARETDMSINALDSYDITDLSETSENGFYAYISAFAEAENRITELQNEGSVDGRPAGMTFGMLLQYSKFTHHRETVDDILVNVFVSAVEAIGDIDYTSDFTEKQGLIDSADYCYEELLNARQRSTAQAEAAKTKLENLRAALQRCVKAEQDAQETIEQLNEFAAFIDSVYSEVHKPSRESHYIEAGQRIATLDEVLETLENARDEMKYAYEYLYANGYTDEYDSETARFTDRFFYYHVQLEIDELWEEAQAAKDEDTLLSSVDVKDLEDEYKALAEYEYIWDTGRNQQEMVENYAKLIWIRQQINANEDAYIAELEEYMDAVGLMDENLTPRTLPISLKANINYAAELYNAMSDTVKMNVDAAYSSQLLMLMDALAELESNILAGIAGDVNEDGRVTISDVVRIVDFALDNGIDPETTVEFVRADIDESNEIDVNDVIAAIDLIEF